VKRLPKKLVEDLDLLNVDDLPLNPYIAECVPNLYPDYTPD
jgi:hypothetical protein